MRRFITKFGHQDFHGIDPFCWKNYASNRPIKTSKRKSPKIKRPNRKKSNECIQQKVFAVPAKQKKNQS